MLQTKFIDDMETNKAFFSRKVEDNMNSLYGLAYRLTNNNADAEDLVAEAVIKAWSKIESLKDKKQFRPWIFRILHNCFISDYRKKSVRPAEESYEEKASGPGNNEISDFIIQQPDNFMHWWANPEIEFVNKLLGDKIMTAIDSLPEAFKVTVLLVNVEGLSYDEAAEVLRVPPGTIRSRMKRGRTLLQKSLWQQAKDEGLIKEDPTRCSHE